MRLWKTQYVYKGFWKKVPQIIHESPVCRVMEFSTSFIFVSEDISACLERNGSQHWNDVLSDEFCWAHWCSLLASVFTAGPLRLGPQSNQVSLGGGRLPKERRSQPRGGSSADASSQRFQHPQDRDRRHARLPGVDRRPVPCAGRPQEERPRVREARQGIHPESQAAGRGQFCAEGIQHKVVTTAKRPDKFAWSDSSPSALRNEEKNGTSVTKSWLKQNAITSYLAKVPQWGVSSSTI